MGPKSNVAKNGTKSRDTVPFKGTQLQSVLPTRRKNYIMRCNSKKGNKTIRGYTHKKGNKTISGYTHKKGE